MGINTSTIIMMVMVDTLFRFKEQQFGMIGAYSSFSSFDAALVLKSLLKKRTVPT